MLSRLKGNIIVFLIITNYIQCSYSYFAIEQCPGTGVPSIRHQTQFYEISLIFYYTQWSDESLESLEQYNKVASYFGDKVYFAAIDCWHLACNCSKTLTTAIGSGSPHKWPTLMVHYGRQGQLKIQYNGLFTFRDMVKFIDNVMQPLERLESRDDLEKMKSSTDAIVWGIFEQPNALEYEHYLRAALKWLEHDPIRTYCFTVTFVKVNDTFNQINVTVPNLLLRGHTTKKSFADYHDYRWNTTSILRWLHEDLNEDYSRLHGYTTPIMIAQKMKKQPVLAIFVNEPQQFFAYMEKYVDQQQPFTKALLACEKAVKRKALESYREKSLHYLKIPQRLQLFNDNLKCHYNKDIVLKHLNVYYEIDQYLNQLYEHFANPAKNKLFYNPHLEAHDLLDFFQSTACLLIKDISWQTPLYISVIKRLESYFANEQQCKNSNRSLTTVILDTRRYRDYLESVYVAPTAHSMATVFIVDNENENMYVMEDRFAMYNLMEFVKNFYSNGLNNYYRNKENLPATIDRVSYLADDYDIVLKSISRLKFLNNLQYAHNQTLVILIHSSDCALCGNMQHSFLQLSLSLRNIKDLKFIRINAMDNDLPWQFNMPFLPALLVFPENRFFESRLFPMHLKPDIRNVFGFILSQLSAQPQVRIVLAVCQGGTLPTGHSQSCWQFAKTILMQHIGKHLHYWQMFEVERSLIFERLRAFKDMSLDIQRNLRL